MLQSVFVLFSYPQVVDMSGSYACAIAHAHVDLHDIASGIPLRHLHRAFWFPLPTPISSTSTTCCVTGSRSITQAQLHHCRCAMDIPHQCRHACRECEVLMNAVCACAIAHAQLGTSNRTITNATCISMEKLYLYLQIWDIILLKDFFNSFHCSFVDGLNVR